MRSPDRQVAALFFSIPFSTSCFISEIAAGDLGAWRRAHASSGHGAGRTICRAVASLSLAPPLLHFSACLGFQLSALVSNNVKANSPCDAMQCFPCLPPMTWPLVAKYY